VARLLPSQVLPFKKVVTQMLDHFESRADDLNDVDLELAGRVLQVRAQRERFTRLEVGGSAVQLSASRGTGAISQLSCPGAIMVVSLTRVECDFAAGGGRVGGTVPP
jgi:hypothetical protein